MKKKIFSVIALVAGLVSCTGDYTDWANPQSNQENPAAQALALAVQPTIGFIDFATETSEDIQLFTTNLPASEFTVDLTGEGTENKVTLAASSDGKVKTADLADAVAIIYGRKGVERALGVTVSGSFKYDTDDGSVIVPKKADPYTLKAKLATPFIDEGYYLTGDFAGWNKEGALAFKHIGGGDVYDNPKFQIIFETTADNQYWKIISKTNYDNDFWAEGVTGVVGTLVDGDTSAEGPLTTTSPQAGKIEKAGLYCMTIDMMDYTYKVEALDFTEFIYVPGNGQGWNPGDAAALHSPGFDGIYTGYVYLDGGFKFTKARNWDAEYNWNDFTSVPSFINNGAGTDTNLYCDDPGVYYIVVNVVEGIIEGSKIENMNLVGDFNGWNQADDAQKMTWDAENLCYTITGSAVTTNGWKFTANNAWDINLGCNDTVEPSNNIGDLTGGGKNIGVAGSTIKLYPCRTTSDKIYCTVE